MDLYEKKLVVMKQSTLSLVRYFDNISVAIIITNSNEEPIEIASGTCIKIGDKYFIATAAHCVKKQDRKNIFLIHTKTPNPRDVEITDYGYRGGEDDDETDVAWITLSDDNAKIFQKKFIELDKMQINISHVDDDLTMVSGYPNELVKVIKENRMFSVRPIGYQTYTIPAENVGSITNDYDIYFDYPKDGNMIYESSENKLPNASGLSGGGFWLVNLNKEGVWSSDSIKLFGIDRSWHPSERWIRGTQLQHWLIMIAEDFPDTKELINSYFPVLYT